MAPKHTEVDTRLRPSAPEDREFLVEVYRSTRVDELALTDWSPEECDRFVRSQFELQDRSYAASFPGYDRSVVMDGATPIGRLYVDRDDDAIRVLDVTILPEHRGRGIGTSLLRDLIAEGERTGRPVRIQVEVFNPARSLYERLGFVPVGELGIRIEMEHTA
jgi:ribosomal protein S18 acetylase RimI-like enzyme